MACPRTSTASKVEAPAYAGTLTPLPPFPTGEALGGWVASVFPSDSDVYMLSWTQRATGAVFTPHRLDAKASTWVTLNEFIPAMPDGNGDFHVQTEWTGTDVIALASAQYNPCCTAGRYTVATNSWSPITLPKGFYGTGGGVSTSRKLLLWTGGPGPQNLVYDLATHALTEMGAEGFPAAAVEAAAPLITVGGRALAFVDVENEDRTHTVTVAEYDEVANRWSQRPSGGAPVVPADLPTEPGERWAFALHAVAVGDDVAVFTGLDPAAYLYHPADNTWKAYPSAPLWVRPILPVGFNGVLVNGVVLFVGNAGPSFPEGESYWMDPRSGVFAPAHPLWTTGVTAGIARPRVLGRQVLGGRRETSGDGQQALRYYLYEPPTMPAEQTCNE
jgi:hypothetical protein